MCLTALNKETDGISQEVHKSTLDNLAYIMPGV